MLGHANSQGISVLPMKDLLAQAMREWLAEPPGRRYKNVSLSWSFLLLVCSSLLVSVGLFLDRHKTIENAHKKYFDHGSFNGCT